MKFTDTVYMIEYPHGGAVDRGGRRTFSLLQMRFWKTEEKAQEYIDKAYFVVDWNKGEKHEDCIILPVQITIDGPVLEEPR